ncbi:MAG: hypothetical protein LBT41_02845, partial [Candidatus Methanoplasma sp.]|nr:hypothetical protein [Candidatus Methanoplasma sp.]
GEYEVQPLRSGNRAIMTLNLSLGREKNFRVKRLKYSPEIQGIPGLVKGPERHGESRSPP